MNIRHSSIAAGLLLLASAGTTAAQTVVIAPEQETVIREYITTQQVQPVELPADVTVTVGATLPETVEVHALEVPEDLAPLPHHRGRGAFVASTRPAVTAPNPVRASP